jgi:hypothetical protein
MPANGIGIGAPASGPDEHDSEDIMLHALSATIGTLAILASLKAKLDYARRMRADAAARLAQPPGQPASPGAR